VWKGKLKKSLADDGSKPSALKLVPLVIKSCSPAPRAALAHN
jgi:hypothetical protein